MVAAPRYIPPPARGGRPPSSDLAERREQYCGMLSHVPEDDAVVREEVRLGDVTCLSFTTPDPCATLLYFHGGAYRAGSPAMFAPFLSRLAAATRGCVIAPQYALAPESPFPGALLDAGAVYRALLTSSGGRPFLIGDSAGGGLALSLALTLLDHAPGISPSGVVLLSPWLDLSLSGESYASRAATDRLFSLAAASEAADLYLQGEDPRHPLASPVHADLTGLPRTLVLVGCNEILLDENLQLAAALARAAVPLEFHAVPDVQHIWPVLELDTPAGLQALAAIASFVACETP